MALIRSHAYRPKSHAAYNSACYVLPRGDLICAQKHLMWCCRVGAVSQTWPQVCGVAYRQTVTSSARQDDDESLGEIIERLDESTARMLL